MWTVWECCGKMTRIMGFRIVIILLLIAGLTLGLQAVGRADSGGFTAQPTERGGTAGAANTILNVRFGQHEGFERLVIDFGNNGKPATQVPEWSLTSPAGTGYALISFPGIKASQISNADLHGSVIGEFYTVRDRDGNLGVLIVATRAFVYRTLELNSPGRLAIDMRSAGITLRHPLPKHADHTVLMQPTGGSVIGGKITVEGYSRNFEATNTIVLRDSSGRALAQKTVKSNDWTEAWGFFSASLQVPAFKGPATLEVGANSPRDGKFTGVKIKVFYKGTITGKAPIPHSLPDTGGGGSST